MVDKYALPRPTIYSWMARKRIYEPDFLRIDSVNMYRKKWVDAWMERKQERDEKKRLLELEETKLARENTKETDDMWMAYLKKLAEDGESD